MDLRDYIERIATDYDRAEGLNTPTQSLLRDAASNLAGHVPGGFLIRGSGGRGMATLTPWFGFLDPDETTSPEDGIYIVYLFSSDLERVYLMLIQGITQLDRDLGHQQARARLAEDAIAIRGALNPQLLEGIADLVDLGTSGFRQLAYTAGYIAARQYDTAALPPEVDLRADLDRFIALYGEAVASKRFLLQAQPGAIASPSVLQRETGDDPLLRFAPKSEDDYVAHLQGRRLVKSRRHERLVRQFGEAMIQRGLVASTAEHPKDLVLRSDGVEWLVEAKVVRQGNATEAVRAAIGQLLTYSRFLPHSDPERLVALFSEDPGDLYVAFLDELSIRSVWASESGWSGSPLAADDRLVD